jgi:hypothetical protein
MPVPLQRPGEGSNSGPPLEPIGALAMAPNTMISIVNCDYTLAPKELGPIIILLVSGTAQLFAI